MSWYSDNEKFNEYDPDYCVRCSRTDISAEICEKCSRLHEEILKEEEDKDE